MSGVHRPHRALVLPAVTVVVALLAQIGLIVGTSSTVAHAATQFDVAVAGPRGPVTVIGDSVLVGAGVYQPTLPDRLVERGWGPIRFRAAGSATSGLFPVDDEFRSSSWITRWKQQGWDPEHVIVNLGTNDSGFCGTDFSCAHRSIMHLVDAIGPGHQIWWPTITKPAAGSRDTYNAALRQVAAERDDVHVWDWNAEFSVGGYRSSDQIHLDPDSYRRRSTRMADVFTTTFARATRVGADEPLPPASGPASTFVPVEPRRLVDTREDPASRPRAGSIVTIDLGDELPEGATAAALYVAAAHADAPGYLSAVPCGQGVSGATVNFTPGGAVGAPTVTALGVDGDVCVVASAGTDVVVDLQGVFVAGTDGLGATPLPTPRRLVDTRRSGRAETVRVPIGDDASVVAVNVAAVGGEGVGFLEAAPCGAPTGVATVNFVSSSPVSAAAFVEVGENDEICVTSSRPVDVVVDLTATLSTSGRLSYVPVTPTRTLDTRDGTGGWAPVHGAGQTIDVGVAPPDAEAVTGTLTVVRPDRTAYATASGCLGDPPTASVNVAAGAIAANSVTTAVLGGRLCLAVSATTNTVFDTGGWWIPSA